MNNDWIKDLKAGDKVYIKSSGIGCGTLHLSTVKRITPKGQVRTEGDNLFKDGYRRVDSWTSEILVEWTRGIEDKLKAEAHFNQLAHSINAVDARTLTPEQVQKIFDIIKTEK